MSKPIDLGKKLDDMIKIHKMDPDEAHYPTLHIDDVDSNRLASMPDSGEATIRYKIKTRSHREEADGKVKKHSCSLCLQIISIDPPQSKKKNGDYDGGARKAMNDYFKDKK